MANNNASDKRPEAQPAVTCRVCESVKPPADFYTNHVRKDGAAGECKECTKARVRHRARNDPKVREYDRQRAKTPQRKAHIRETTMQWRTKNEAGYKAHTAVSNAIRDGRLIKEPCLFCDAHEVHAHHRDYAKPLEVVWLCPKCHHRLHAAFPESEGLNKTA